MQGNQQHGFLQLRALPGLQLRALGIRQLALRFKRRALRLKRHARRSKRRALHIKRRKLHLKFGKPAFKRCARRLHCRALCQQHSALRLEVRLQRCKFFLRRCISSARQLLQVKASSG